MKPSAQATQVQPVTAAAIPGLAALAFGSGSNAVAPGGKHLAFLPLESLELDLNDPEQRDFGDYQLVEQLGQGGMGVVYRAHQTSLDREVALKLLAAGPWASPEFIARFRREAQSAARLQHPNIVPIYEIGTHAELNFFSMALVRGESLSQRIKASGALPPRLAASLLRTIAEALDYAHRLGILHLDLKPANVLLDEHGEPQVADFGLAKRLDDALSNDSEEVSGTPSYMAPEQAQVKSHRLSVATDVYGLGAILYELLCGKPPFQASTARDTLLKVINLEPLSLHSQNPKIPIDLDAICLKCLSKDPAQRYLNARALAEDLGRFLEGRAVSVRPLNAWQRTGRWARREPRVAIAAALAVSALVVGLVATSVQWRRAEQGAAQVRETLWQKRVDDAAQLIRQRKTLDTLPELVQNLAEQESSGASEQAELSRLRIGSVLAEAPVLIDSIAVGERITQLLLDREERWAAVATGNGSGVRLHDLSTGELRWAIAIDVLGVAVRLTLARDGRHLIAEAYNLAVPLARGLNTFLIDIESGELRKPPAELFPRLFVTHFSPDGGFALVVVQSASDGGGLRARLVRVADWQVLGDDIALDGPTLLGPGGVWFAYHRGNVRETGATVEVHDARDMSLRWTYRPAGGAALRAWRIAPVGERLAIGFSDGEISLFDPADGTRVRLPSTVNAAVEDLHFSPDGLWLGASHVDGSVQVWDVNSAAAVVLPLHLSANQDDIVGAMTLDAQRRQVYVAEPEHSRLWYLPGPEQPAQALFERPSYPRAIITPANDALIARGLFAFGASDGELRLWRHRQRQPLPGRTPLREMRDAQRRFDGRRMLQVDAGRVQVADLDGRALGVAHEFPQAVGFAELLAPGSAEPRFGGFFVATAGPELHVRDVSSGAPRFAPVQLPATPSALLVAPDGNRLVAAWVERSDAGAVLALRSLDARTGATEANARLDHPAYRLQYADDSQSLIVWRNGPLTLLDAAKLQARWPPRSFAEVGDFTPVRGARLGVDGRTLWVVSGSGGEDGYRMHALSARDGAQLRVWRLPSWAWALQPFEDGNALAALLPGQNEARLFRLEGADRTIKLAGMNERGYPGIALSEDGRRLAVGIKQGVQWLSLPDGNWLTPPIQSTSGVIEFSGVALDASGTLALMQDSDRRRWRIEMVREHRPIAELQALIGLLIPSDQDPPETHFAERDPGLRSLLRAADPGPPAASAVLSQQEAHLDQLDPRFVDLRPNCNFELDQHPNPLHQNPRLDRLLAPGRQRLSGVDFEVHCAIWARYRPNAEPSVELGSRIEGIAVATSEVAAVELLVMASTVLKDEVREAYAIIEFGYRDGTRARADLIYKRDIEPWFAVDIGARSSESRVAYVGHGAQFSLLGGMAPSPPRLYAVRIANPHPHKALASLAFESTRVPWSSPLLLAATLEPLVTPPDANAIEVGELP